MSKDKRIWIKLAVGMPDIPKIAVLSSDAFRSYIEMLCYSRDHLTDGFIHKRIATRMWGDSIEELCTNDPVKPSLIRVAGGFQIHDYSEHQETRADVERRRANSAKGGLRKAANRSGTNSGASSGTTSGTSDKGGVFSSATPTESRVQSPERLSIKTLSSQSSSTRARELSTDPETNHVLAGKAERCGFTDAGQVFTLMEEIKTRCDRDVEPFEVFNLIDAIVKKSKVLVRNPLAYALTAIDNDPGEVRKLIDAGIPWETPRLEAV